MHSQDEMPPFTNDFPCHAALSSGTSASEIKHYQRLMQSVIICHWTRGSILLWDYSEAQEDVINSYRGEEML